MSNLHFEGSLYSGVAFDSFDLAQNCVPGSDTVDVLALSLPLTPLDDDTKEERYCLHLPLPGEPGHFVVTGDVLMDGLNAYGPFADHETAQSFAEDFSGNSWYTERAPLSDSEDPRYDLKTLLATGPEFLNETTMVVALRDEPVLARLKIVGDEIYYTAVHDDAQTEEGVLTQEMLDGPGSPAEHSAFIEKAKSVVALGPDEWRDFVDHNTRRERPV